MRITKHLVAGIGEVGTAIEKIFDADCLDQNKTGRQTADQYDYLHICFPYSDLFIGEVTRYQMLYSPKYTIIHSTVPVGTSRKCNAMHSPIRGLHPNLYEGILTFEKFIGGSNASLVADEFRRHGLKIILCDTPEATELGKLLDTEYYRACIEFTQRAKALSIMYNVPFHEAYTLFNQTYNAGYTKLGFSEYVRPILQPIMTDIGGHCVIPNSKLI